MCGIVGKINFDRAEPVSSVLLRQMMDRMKHRGPDGSGTFVAGFIGLGHRRLSIIDLDTGGQPLANEDETVWVVYNGEIYNFVELRTELQARGHIFRTTTDTEVIVHLYEELGEQCVTRLRGMFAFALWDERTQLLLLARDRVGIKPLYYATSSKSLIFASEIKSLLVDPCVSREVNLRAIDRFITYHYLPGNETLFLGIYKLDPGFVLTVRDGVINKKRYWDLEFHASPDRKSFKEAVDELRVLLRRTVRDHMISDVPVGVLLSGGVDSTGILRYAVEHSDRPLHTFTVGFADAAIPDERPFARLAAKTFRTVHHEITFGAQDFADIMPSYVWHIEEPIFEPPAIALYLVSRLAQQSCVKVLLSGEGGDEAFGGYQNYRNLLVLEKLKRALGPGRKALRIGLQLAGRVGSSRAAKYSQLVDIPLSDYYLSRTSTPFSPFNSLKATLYTPDFQLEVAKGGESRGSIMSLLDKKYGSALDQMLYVDTKTWLPDDLLLKADKMTMATSVELRVPLLDSRILEFAASLPGEYKVYGLTTKRILKAALAQSVPKAILSRRKTGFPVPYDKWLRNELRDFVGDLLLGAGTAVSTYFSKRAVHDLIVKYNRGEGGAREVFCLLVLELWHNVFAGPSIDVGSDVAQ